MKLEKIQRIVLVGHDNEGSSKLFEKITNSNPDAEYLLIIGRGLYYKKTMISSIVKLLKEASLIFVIIRFIELVRYQLQNSTLKNKAKMKGIPIIYTHDINSQDTIEQIKKFAPDLLVSLFTMQIFKAPVLQISKYGSITSHPSILPKYRGLEVFFWVLANNEKETGVSVFFMSENIDDGIVFEQQNITISADMSMTTLYRIITDVGGNLLVKAINDIDKNTITPIITTGIGSYYPMPTRKSMLNFLKLKKKFY